MGRTKLGNANAQRNNNAKKKNGFNTEFATESYSQMEAAKLISSKKTAPKIETASLDAVFIIFAPVVQ
ncbi:hypothetical protein [Bacillus licheniformis]|uniref:hypothetical protein n=1 Tax=Bacillus licheniformis TaxID=1402 RepID=UPI003D73FC61